MANQGTEEYARSVPLYTIAEAAHIIGISPATMRNWIAGYTYPTTYQGMKQSGPLVTSRAPVLGLTIPFDGLAEAFVLTRLREAGVPMRRIRPAVEKLRDEFGVEHALLSDRLKTDGARVLFEYITDDDKDHAPATNLAEITTKQIAFAEELIGYLQTISYDDHLIRAFTLPGFDVDVVVDPEVNAGRPTLAEYWVRLDDLRDRAEAGESSDELADDYGIPEASVRALVDA